MKRLSDVEIVSHIQAGGLSRDTALAELTKDEQCFRKVAAYITQHQGNEQDAEDIWLDGIITLDENIRFDKYQKTGSVRDYLVGICKLRWQNRRRANAKVSLGDISYPGTPTYNPSNQMEDKDQSRYIRKVLADFLGETCLQVLLLWIQDFSMKEIAAEVGLSSADMAKKRKYECFRALKEKLGNDPDWLKWLK